MPENIQDPLAEVRQLFSDAIRKNGKPSRVPIYANDWGWKMHDAGFTYQDALYNNESMEKVIQIYCDRYPVDSVADAGGRNPLSLTKVFGSDKFYLIDDENHTLTYKDVSHLYAEDYDALIENPMKFFWEILIPRKCDRLQDKTNGHVFLEGVGAFAAYGQSQANIAGIQLSHGKLLGFNQQSGIYTSPSIETLFSQLRGIKGLSVDLRRNKEKVKAAMKAIDSILEPDYEQMPYGHDPNYAYDGFNAMIVHTILSMPQFEELYFPYLKKNVEASKSKDRPMLIFAEGNTERFYDHFRDLPSGIATFLPEQNDIFKAKEALPNMSIAGGMPTSLLGKGTPEECVEYAKRLLIELGSEGGYIFSEDKMMSYPTDAKRENLSAVYEFVKNYRF